MKQGDTEQYTLSPLALEGCQRTVIECHFKKLTIADIVLVLATLGATIVLAVVFPELLIAILIIGIAVEVILLALEIYMLCHYFKKDKLFIVIALDIDEMLAICTRNRFVGNNKVFCWKDVQKSADQTSDKYKAANNPNFTTPRSVANNQATCDGKYYSSDQSNKPKQYVDNSTLKFNQQRIVILKQLSNKIHVKFIAVTDSLYDTKDLKNALNSLGLPVSNVYNRQLLFDNTDVTNFDQYRNYEGGSTATAKEKLLEDQYSGDQQAYKVILIDNGLYNQKKFVRYKDDKELSNKFIFMHIEPTEAGGKKFEKILQSWTR